jgi:glucokinase
VSAEPGAVLAVDVGGTKTALALASARAGGPIRQQRFASADWEGFEPLLDAFLAEAGRPRIAAAAIAAAGPVASGVVEVTNLPWPRIEAARIERALDARVVLLNDVVATALGMLELPDDAFALLQGARLREPGTLAVLAPGTGLGEALIAFDGERTRVLPSEGGHGSYAPRTARERALLAHLAGAGDAHVSVEDVIAGPGIVRVHAFLQRERGNARSLAIAGAADPAAAITDAALRGDDPVCVEALELYLGSWGAHAGDLALRGLARGGVWLGGGIAPRLVDALRRGPFLEAFRAKGERFHDWLAALPVAVCLTPDAALHGALREARALASAKP